MVMRRLMSGLQASISTHIARDYFYETSRGGTWGNNIPLYVKAVGAHPERINNLYFAFLFLLRAVSKVNISLWFEVLS
jgi:abortive infection bacteriophage resistance protein